ncbi:hypothetical protein OIO90_001536 [Microbotryomycetes sp. JL221]|nr:hypothetical protein OIO90_001536 [Microbotryomycetes sp. JL221]
MTPMERPTTSDGLSSPTTSMFYGHMKPRPGLSVENPDRRPLPASRSASYKSTASVRSATRRAPTRPQHALSSSPTSLSTVHFNNARLSARGRRSGPGFDRGSVRVQRDLNEGDPENPWARASASEPGALNKEGEWEEWTDQEDFLIGLEVMRARREWRARHESLLPSSDFDEADIDDAINAFQDDTVPEEPEPPEDVFDTTPPANTPIVPYLPLLAVDPGGSSQHTASAPSQATNASMELDSTARGSREPTSESCRAFEQAILATDCPNCSTRAALAGDVNGLRCQQCGWNVPVDVMRATQVSFAAHHGGDYVSHLPLLHFSPYMGTLVSCSACEEEYGL